jgi:hypothetical protein
MTTDRRGSSDPKCDARNRKGRRQQFFSTQSSAPRAQVRLKSERSEARPATPGGSKGEQARSASFTLAGLPKGRRPLGVGSMEPHNGADDWRPAGRKE